MLKVLKIYVIFPWKNNSISTDYVFNGEKGAYAEDDRVAPLSVYGATKLEAERITMSHSSKFSIELMFYMIITTI